MQRAILRPKGHIISIVKSQMLSELGAIGQRWSFPLTALATHRYKG